MVMEATRALFGSLLAASGPLFAAAPGPEDSRREVRLKARAWKLVSHEAKQSLPPLPGVQVCSSPALPPYCLSAAIANETYAPSLPQLCIVCMHRSLCLCHTKHHCSSAHGGVTPCRRLRAPPSWVLLERPSGEAS